ncbi:baseplate J/gp47 family protein [Pasteurella multocida]|uniref:Baseplate J/gp47 family protein n=1 Tax=Pasteurella multocida TaxID=747 RepID=A0AAW8VB09_PASMD|nr:baseplate J/gp47 family protein [Pasteurella multocida]MDH7436189.1 baseplate J/gp47 family protein [Pasteurella multocida]MDH7440011.1 baseplate J/gp47 family protein [Pasteurella multocida]MDT3453439.1 baseplate J/gp47 family protein [Pasteurella multocida]MDY0427562.1 baseplate J/gp47 family protein [Pasteurella multocida]MDY0434059.1 baseplate J/gp47 family protein [Pasteurella multocida]
MAKLVESGIVIERLDSILERVEQGFKRIYGQNINIDPDTPDGQMIGILGQIKVDLEELAEDVYRQLDPDLATGAWLEQRVAYAGLVRRKASYSYLRSVILTGDPYTEINNLIVSDTNKTRWILEQKATLNESGSARADFRSEELGAFSLNAHTQLTIETITLGLNSVTTSVDAEIGIEEETDSQLRQRFSKSRAKNAINSAEAIEGEIGDLADVKQVIVLENNTSQTDSIGIPPHSINVVVEGGNETDIAQVIYKNKGAGIGLQGQTSVNLMINGKQRAIKFDKATPVDVHISMTLVRYEDFTEIDKDEVKRMLSNVKFKIGEDVSLSRLYSPINTVGGFWVKSLKIGKSSGVLNAENIVIQPRELARIQRANIQIEVE